LTTEIAISAGRGIFQQVARDSRVAHQMLRDAGADNLHR
jgi:hypothetical protein